MLPPSMANRGVASWISFLRASHVSHGVPLGAARASRTSGGSGPTSRESFATFDRSSCSWKTCRPSLLEEASDGFSETWPTSGSMRSGRVYEQPTWVPVISAIDCSSWPTAGVTDGKCSGRHSTETGVMHPGTSLQDAIRLWRTPDAPTGGAGVRNRQDSRGNGHQIVLAEQAEHWSSWPTPAARDYKGENSDAHLLVATGRKHLDQLPNFVRQIWPTPATDSFRSRSGDRIEEQGLDQACRSFRLDPQNPSAGEPSSASSQTLRQLSFWKTPHGIANTDQYGKTGGGGGEFAKQAMAGAPKTARLNPIFVEWLMGLPQGWTGFAPVAIQSYRSKQLRHLWSWVAAWESSAVSRIEFALYPSED